MYKLVRKHTSWNFTWFHFYIKNKIFDRDKKRDLLFKILTFIRYRWDKHFEWKIVNLIQFLKSFKIEKIRHDR